MGVGGGVTNKGCNRKSKRRKRVRKRVVAAFIPLGISGKISELGGEESFVVLFNRQGGDRWTKLHSGERSKTSGDIHIAVSTVDGEVDPPWKKCIK